MLGIKVYMIKRALLGNAISQQATSAATADKRWRDQTCDKHTHTHTHTSNERGQL